MSAPELAACPFCGGEAEIWRANGERTAWIACMGRCSVLVSKEHKTDEEAIAAWNRRADLHDATLTALRAQVETLREALEALVGDDVVYSGPSVVIRCADHGEAIGLVAKARAALSAVSRDDTSEVSDV